MSSTRRGFRAARARWRTAASLPLLTRRVAWTGVKLLGALAVREAVRRARAGPVRLSVAGPTAVVDGDSFFVESRLESPFLVTTWEAYFAGSWTPAPRGGPAWGLRRERWVFRAEGAGLRPVIVRARDAEGHVATRTRWVLVVPRAAGPLLPGRRLGASGGAPRVAEAPTQDA